MRYHLTPVKMAITKKTEKVAHVGKGEENREFLMKVGM
jgi:hypothetical protein